MVHPRTANPPHYDFVVGLFTTRGLQPTLLERDIAWIPLTDTESVTVTLVLPTGQQSPVTDRFERVSRTYASDNGWLP